MSSKFKVGDFVIAIGLKKDAIYKWPNGQELNLNVTAGIIVSVSPSYDDWYRVEYYDGGSVNSSNHKFTRTINEDDLELVMSAEEMKGAVGESAFNFKVFDIGSKVKLIDVADDIQEYFLNLKIYHEVLQGYSPIGWFGNAVGTVAEKLDKGFFLVIFHHMKAIGGIELIVGEKNLKFTNDRIENDSSFRHVLKFPKPLGVIGTPLEKDKPVNLSEEVVKHIKILEEL